MLLFRNLLLLTSSLFLATVGLAQGGKQGLQKDAGPLQYLVREPLVKSEHMPVVILVHGRGGDENSLFSRANELPKEALIVAPRGPIALGGAAFAWYHVSFGGDAPAPNAAEAESSRVLLAGFIKQITEKYHVDPSRVYLMGFSQGGAMTLSIALTEPALVKGSIALSGRVLDEIQQKLATDEQLKHLALFICHGTNDQLLPVKFARQNRAFLEQHHIDLAYHEYEMGHEIIDQEMKDVQGWLKKQLAQK